MKDSFLWAHWREAIWELHSSLHSTVEKWAFGAPQKSFEALDFIQDGIKELK